MIAGWAATFLTQRKKYRMARLHSGTHFIHETHAQFSSLSLSGSPPAESVTYPGQSYPRCPTGLADQSSTICLSRCGFTGVFSLGAPQITSGLLPGICGKFLQNDHIHAVLLCSCSAAALPPSPTPAPPRRVFKTVVHSGVEIVDTRSPAIQFFSSIYSRRTISHFQVTYFSCSE